MSEPENNTSVNGADLRADDPEARSAAARAMGSARTPAKTEKGRELVEALREKGIMGGRKTGYKMSEEAKARIGEKNRQRAAEKRAAKEAATREGQP